MIRLGKISVEIFNGKMVMKTENIRRFQFVDLPRWKKLLTYTTSAYHTYSEPSDSSSNVNGARYWRGDVKSWEIDETLLGVPPQIGPSYVNNENRDDTWKISTDLLWLSDERHSSTYGPAFHVKMI